MPEAEDTALEKVPENRGRFSATNQPAHKPGRRKKSVLYAGQIRDLEDMLADSLPAVAAEKLKIALGQAKEALINHKTGEVHMVPVNPATQLKAIVAIEERIMGRPEAVTKHDVGEAAADIFNILIGPAATQAWENLGAIEALSRETEGRETPELPDKAALGAGPGR